jgi:hypothetical protein
VVTSDETSERAEHGTDAERYELEPRVTGITPFRVLFPIGAILFIAAQILSLPDVLAGRTSHDDDDWVPGDHGVDTRPAGGSVEDPDDVAGRTP